MHKSIRAWRAAPLMIVVMALVLAGCQKLGPGTGAYYTNTEALLLEKPEHNAKVLAGIGVNSKVTVTGTKGGFSRISIDEGRITGWVDSNALSTSPVAEPIEPPSKAPARKARAAPSAKPQAAPESAPAPAEAQPSQAASPANPPSQPESSAPSGVMSPGEAKAAPPPPPEPKPGTGRQAKPEAFEPF